MGRLFSNMPHGDDETISFTILRKERINEAFFDILENEKLSKKVLIYCGLRANYTTFAGVEDNNWSMEIKFEKDYLEELYLKGKTSDKKHRFQPPIVTKYRKTIDLLK